MRRSSTATVGGSELMSEAELRMTERDHPPGDAEVREWIGEAAYRHWRSVTELIDQLYPGVFAPEWLYGGKKHGWALRYKKNKPLCTLVPERGRFRLLVVFGGEERAKVEALRERLSSRALEEYDTATTYHDGKWVLFTIDSDDAERDVARLWAIKRRPNTIIPTTRGDLRE